MDRVKLALISIYKIDVRKSIYTKLIDNQDLRLIKMHQDKTFVLPGMENHLNFGSNLVFY